ncbi:sigma-54-dependent transcriptional regulator [Alteribacillus bidgolensis]|uniref:Regulatory protein, Fis family n=1 Tax=Alteribacillus bidgolensis TaxID=930129 RepID=A0A1G8NHQ4_9BACI|nr:sigma-54-dependent transcriptional regulator [Alteribacillus bidgolensis]SDI79596.1 regulatory protein, Fis family [Alteribacillus bidgolensis]
MKIGIIAPYEGMAQRAKSLEVNNNHLTIRVETGDLREALTPLAEMEKEGFQTIISRGGTAQLIREHTTLPVIEIGVSGYDILRLIMMARQWGESVELIGFPNVCSGFQEMMDILNIHIPYTTIYSSEEVLPVVQDAKTRGVSTVIGDTITVRQAERLGMTGILINSGIEAIEEAVEQAKTSANLMHRQQQILQGFQHLLHNVKEPLVLFNEEGEITFENHAGTHFLQDYLLTAEIDKWPKKLRDVWVKLMKEGQIHEWVVFANKRWEAQGEQLHQNGEKLFYIKLEEERRFSINRTDLAVLPLETTITSFQHILLPEGMDVPEVIDTVKQFRSLAIVGEKGTGKRTIASAIHSELYDFSASKKEITIRESISEDSLLLIQETIKVNNGVLYIKGWEYVEPAQIQHWLALAAESRAVLVFAAEDRHVVDTVFQNEQVLTIPALRERFEHIKTFTLPYIAQYNAVFGKQIIGLNDEAYKALKEKDWENNLNDLRLIIKNAIKQSDGPYITRTDLKTNESENEYATMDIPANKTLAELEHDIIEHVMKEEDYNQTKVAERLGINRSTLWRKLKN